MHNSALLGSLDELAVASYKENATAFNSIVVSDEAESRGFESQIK